MTSNPSPASNQLASSPFRFLSLSHLHNTPLPHTAFSSILGCLRPSITYTLCVYGSWVHNTCASPAHPILNHFCILFFGFFRQLVMNHTGSSLCFCFLPAHTLSLSPSLLLSVSIATHATLPCLLMIFLLSCSFCLFWFIPWCVSLKCMLLCLYPSLLFFVCRTKGPDDPGYGVVQGKNGK